MASHVIAAGAASGASPRHGQAVAPARRSAVDTLPSTGRHGPEADYRGVKIFVR
jgi:hypothetical protein